MVFHGWDYSCALRMNGRSSHSTALKGVNTPGGKIWKNQFNIYFFVGECEIHHTPPEE